MAIIESPVCWTLRDFRTISSLGKDSASWCIILSTIRSTNHTIHQCSSPFQSQQFISCIWLKCTSILGLFPTSQMGNFNTRNFCSSVLLPTVVSSVAAIPSISETSSMRFPRLHLSHICTWLPPPSKPTALPRPIHSFTHYISSVPKFKTTPFWHTCTSSSPPMGMWYGHFGTYKAQKLLKKVKITNKRTHIYYTKNGKAAHPPCNCMRRNFVLPFVYPQRPYKHCMQFKGLLRINVVGSIHMLMAHLFLPY